MESFYVLSVETEDERSDYYEANLQGVEKVKSILKRRRVTPTVARLWERPYRFNTGEGCKEVPFTWD